MKTPYSLQAVLSLLCLKKEFLDSLIWKRTLLNTHSYKKPPPSILQNHKEFWRWEVKTFRWLLKVFTAWSYFNDLKKKKM